MDRTIIVVLFTIGFISLIATLFCSTPVALFTCRNWKIIYWSVVNFGRINLNTSVLCH